MKRSSKQSRKGTRIRVNLSPEEIRLAEQVATAHCFHKPNDAIRMVFLKHAHEYLEERRAEPAPAREGKKGTRGLFAALANL